MLLVYKRNKTSFFCTEHAYTQKVKIIACIKQKNLKVLHCLFLQVIGYM